jgi:RNA polymerase sigma factor (TIGR02999 family)
MTDVTQILSQIEQGDPSSAEQLLPLVYEELRNLAAAKLAQERPGQTLQATALVHEAFVRLVDTDKAQHWNSRAHFYAAAAEAMRRILVDNARRKRSLKRGGDRVRLDMNDSIVAISEAADDLVALDEALNKLEGTDKVAAKLVKLRFFAGLTMQSRRRTHLESPCEPPSGIGPTAAPGCTAPCTATDLLPNNLALFSVAAGGTGRRITHYSMEKTIKPGRRTLRDGERARRQAHGTSSMDDSRRESLQHWGRRGDSALVACLRESRSSADQ